MRSRCPEARCGTGQWPVGRAPFPGGRSADAVGRELASPFLTPLAVALAAGLLLCAVGGCDRASGTSEAAPPAASSDPQIDAQSLMALPYAGSVRGSEEDEQSGVMLYDEQRSYPGYNLYSAHKLCRADLIDARGQIVRSWRHPGNNWANVELLDNGDLLVVGAEPSDSDAPGAEDAGRYVLRFDFRGALLWKRHLTAHHDIEPTPDGGLMTITFRRRPIPAVHAKIDTRDDELTLLSAEGEIVQSLSLFDALSRRPEIFPLRGFAPTRTPDGAWIDVFHANSLERMAHAELARKSELYDPANILVCFRHQDRVAVINWERQEVVWAWGLGEISGPHDAQTLPDGNILLFDNGLKAKRSRVIEIDPASGQIVWEYESDDPADFFSVSKGSAQRLPNGNTLIANSDSGQAFEVTRAGEKVWEFFCPHRDPKAQRGTIVRIKRYERDFIDKLLAGP